MALYTSVATFDVSAKLVKYVQTLNEKAAKEKRLNSLAKDSLQEKAAREDFEAWLKSDIVVNALSYKTMYDKLTAYERDIVTLGTGEFPKTLDTPEVSAAVDKITGKLTAGTLSGQDVRDFVKVAADAFGQKIKAYKDSDATLIETFSGSRFTGFRVSKGVEPIKAKKRSAKNWVKQLALYLYASAVTSTVQ